MRHFVFGLCVLLAVPACGSNARPAARRETPTPSVTASLLPTASPSPSPTAAPTKTPSASPRSATPTRTATRKSASPTAIVAPPPGSEPFTAPTFVSNKLGGCAYLGDGHWRVRYLVTVRGGQNWQFSDSSPNAMPFGAEHAGTTHGSGDAATGTFDLHVHYVKNADGGGIPEEFDQKVYWYAVRKSPTSKTIDVKLPAAYQLTAHCTR